MTLPPAYEIREDPKFQYLIQQRSLKPKTIKNYRQNYVLFCRATGMTLTELIQEARTEQVKTEWMDERQLPTHFQTFTVWMEHKGYAPYRIKMAIDNVKSFYHEFQIETPRTKYKAVPKSYHVLFEDLPQFKDIQKAIDLSNIKYTALFTTMASSAMNYIDVINITIQDLIDSVNYFLQTEKHKTSVDGLEGLYEIVEEIKPIIPIHRMWRIKSGNYHLTFQSPESLNFILKYFDSHVPESLQSPIFRRGGNIPSEDPLSYITVQNYLSKINKKAGWDKKVGYFNYVTSKSFRVFFANELEDERINYRHIRLMMGHAMPGVDRNYFKKNARNLLESYKKGVHRLTFIQTVDTIEIESEAVIQMKKEQAEKDQKYQEELGKRDERLRVLEEKVKIIEGQKDVDKEIEKLEKED